MDRRKTKFGVVLAIMTTCSLFAHAGTNSNGCIDPDLSKVGSTQTFTMCDGSTAKGTYNIPSTCSSDAQTGCVATSVYVAADTSKFTADKIRLGSKAAGVSGTRRDVFICTSGKGITSANGTSTVPWDGTRTGTGTVTVGIGSAAVTGAGTFFNTHLGIGENVKVAGETHKISAIGSGTAMTMDANWGVAAGPGAAFTNWQPNTDYSVDDMQNNASPWYTGSARTNCNESTITDVSNTGTGFVPDASKDSNWTKIYQDQLTGTYFTNVLYQQTKNWPSALSICNGLSGGTGGSGWRLPTHKEILQLAIDGVSQVSAGFSSFNNYFWASTAQTTASTNAWTVETSNIRSRTWAPDTANSVYCVRP